MTAVGTSGAERQPREHAVRCPWHPARGRQTMTLNLSGLCDRHEQHPATRPDPFTPTSDRPAS